MKMKPAHLNFFGVADRFEIYRIVFGPLAENRKDLKSIQIYSRYLHTLFSQDDNDVPVGEEIPLSTPDLLDLQQPICNPIYEPLEFVFGNYDWNWNWNCYLREENVGDTEVDTILTKRVNDAETDSYADITYADEIELARPFVVSHLDARLDVMVCLVYCFEDNGEQVEGTIMESHDFYAPTSPCKDTWVFCGTHGDLKLNLEVNWIDAEFLQPSSCTFILLDDNGNELPL